MFPRSIFLTLLIASLVGAAPLRAEREDEPPAGLTAPAHPPGSPTDGRPAAPWDQRGIAAGVWLLTVLLFSSGVQVRRSVLRRRWLVHNRGERRPFAWPARPGASADAELSDR